MGRSGDGNTARRHDEALEPEQRIFGTFAVKIRAGGTAASRGDP
ncbi:MAG: hypothetical protein QME60_06485 [Verrucomicrobiota bacterium]|nr:hypothetical protein [Verrucomicrobiota bacterium]